MPGDGEKAIAEAGVHTTRSKNRSSENGEVMAVGCLEESSRTMETRKGMLRLGKDLASWLS